MSTDNGGPAFPGEPATRFGEANEYNQGMTMRDYFAAKAMQSYITIRINSGIGEDNFDPLISKWAYEMADAMLKARGEG